MDLVKIKDIFTSPDINKNVTIAGWVRAFRAKKFIELNSNNIVKPYEYMGHVCDDHYSKYGAQYISNVIIKLINNY